MALMVTSVVSQDCLAVSWPRQLVAVISHRGLGSMLGHSMWNLCWRK